MRMRFCPIASGSNGNCLYVGTQRAHLLLDAGISGRNAEKALSALNINGNLLDAIFVTHEHADHLAGVGVLSRRFNLPVFATRRVWGYIDRVSNVGGIAPENRRVLVAGSPVAVKDIAVRPFNVPHDAAETLGYTFESQGLKAAVATDLGHAPDDVVKNLNGADILLLESNHDVRMLKSGRYPPELKERVLGDYGHLSNADAGQLLARVAGARLKHVFLGHLSAENNTPMTALETVSRVLLANGIVPNADFGLYIARRGRMSDPIALD